MGATKKLLVQMHEKEYAEIPTEMKLRFISSKVVYDDYDEYKEDPMFKKLYKAKKDASKALDDWKYDQRHKK